MRTMRRVHAAAITCALLIAASACGGKSPAVTARVAAYVGTDVCSGHVDASGCVADAANGCAWTALMLACPVGATCPVGFCHQPNPCEAHGDATSCGADTANGCAWAAVDPALAVCPDGADCTATAGAGFCFDPSAQTGGGCACACPLYCPQGAECPPCDCACPPPPTGGGSGGGTCTCACAACAPGETCPPCDCTCPDPGTGGGTTCGGTCTCACPVCDPSSGPCPACDCVCDGGPAPAPPTDPTMCTCPACTGTGPCPACDCPTPLPPLTDPCGAYADATACNADSANQCGWIALGVPCQVGTTCISGVCQQLVAIDGGVGGGGGCVCGCPVCDPTGGPCPPCGCDCSGGTGTTGCP